MDIIPNHLSLQLVKNIINYMNFNILKILLISICFISIGCETTDKSDKINVYSPFPIEPNWTNFTRKPVIKSYLDENNKNFIVSDEMVKKSLQMTEYLERIDNWKTSNSIP